MKKPILLSLLCYTLSANAQQVDFSYATGTYTEITGGTSILAGSAFNDSINLGYNITIAGISGSELQILKPGRITTAPYSGASPWFWAFEGADLFNGTVSYLTTGTAGNRITKIQFKDNEFGHEWGNGNQSRCNFQIWLYEKDKAIEVRFGPSNIVDALSCYQGASGPVIGMPNVFAKGSASSPMGGTAPTYLTGTPPNGAIYRYGPPVNGVFSYSKTASEISLYPVPAKNMLYVRSDKHEAFNFRIYDALGKTISAGYQKDASSPIDVSSLPSGSYIININNDKVLKFSKD